MRTVRIFKSERRFYLSIKLTARLIHDFGYSVCRSRFFMIRLLFLSVIFLSLSAFAQTSTDCHDSLLNGQSDSASHRLNTTKFDAGPNETLNESSALNATKKILEEANCKIDDLTLEASCSEIKKGSNRMACLVEVKGLAGFFTIVKDYVDTFHLIYSRWD